MCVPLLLLYLRFHTVGYIHPVLFLAVVVVVKDHQLRERTGEPFIISQGKSRWDIQFSNNYVCI